MLTKIVEYANYLYDYFGSDGVIKKDGDFKKDDDHIVSQIRADRYPLDAIIESLLSTPMEDNFIIEIDCSTIQTDNKIQLKKINSPSPNKESNSDKIQQRKDSSKNLVPCIVIGKYLLKQIVINELVYYDDLRQTKIIFGSCSRLFWFRGEIPKQKIIIGNTVDANVSITDTDGHIQYWITMLSKRKKTN